MTENITDLLLDIADSLRAIARNTAPFQPEPDPEQDDELWLTHRLRVSAAKERFSDGLIPFMPHDDHGRIDGTLLTRIVNALIRNGYTDRAEVQATTDDELLNIRNFGQKCLKIVREWAPMV